jgi:hypothetical protein
MLEEREGVVAPDRRTVTLDRRTVALSLHRTAPVFSPAMNGL